jgi:hypothetical protein
MLQLWQHYVRPLFAVTASIQDPAQRKRVVDAVAHFARFDAPSR